MLLERRWNEDAQEYRLVSHIEGYYLRTHAESEDCYEHGCSIHFPTPTAVENVEHWPYLWRSDRSLLERLCSHSIGHPDPDAANFNIRMGRPYENDHGCDGCCHPMTR